MNLRYSSVQNDIICSLYREGFSTTQISRSLGVPQPSVSEILHRHGIPSRPYHGASRLYETDDTVFSDPSRWLDYHYWLYGLLVTDGCVNDKAGTLALRLAEKDIEVFDKVKRILRTNAPVHVRIPSLTSPKSYNSGPYAILKVKSSQICDDLTRLGCPSAKTFKLTYPSWLSDSQAGHFLRGVIDGDGCISVSQPRGTIEVTIVGNEPFMLGIRDMLKRRLDIDMGINTSPHRDSRIIVIRTGKHESVSRLLDFVYRDASVFLTRKYQKAWEAAHLLGTKAKTPNGLGALCAVLALAKQHQNGGELPSLVSAPLSPSPISEEVVSWFSTATLA